MAEAGFAAKGQNGFFIGLMVVLNCEGGDSGDVESRHNLNGVETRLNKEGR